MLNKLSKLFFWLFLISLPFSYRHLFFQFTPGFDEYEAVFLYAGDILLVLFLIFNFKNIYGYIAKNRIFSGLLGIFLLTAGLSIFLASYKILAFYNFIRLVLPVLAALAIAGLLKKGLVSLEKILAVLAASAVFQSLLAFLQFFIQKSLGLKYLGESVLGVGIPGVSKVIIGGVRILRAYGTFPHPNILAAFLLLGLFSCFYFLFKENKSEKKFLIGKLPVISALFVIVFGLILTFSRTAWVLGLVLSLIYIFYILSFKAYRFQAAYKSIILIFIFLLIVGAASQLIFPRAKISLNEVSVSQRILYNKIGLYLIAVHPLGIGLGNQVIYSVKNGLYQTFGMDQVWQWQPIHNIYLLIGSEIGVLGLAIFLAFIIWLMIFLVKDLAKKRDLKDANILLIAGLMILSLLGFGLFDHFLWTLQPGRLMLWLILGIILGIKSEKHLPS